jgi:DnaB-like helicase N terminal domain/AAA domain
MDKDEKRQPELPYSADAEKGVLCSLALSPKEVGELCAQCLQPNAFHNPIHRTIYETLLEWKGVGAVEFPWLKEEIKKRGKLEDFGGPEFLDALLRFVPTAANAQYYIDGVRERYALRQLIKGVNEFSEQPHDTDIRAVLADLEPDIHVIVHSTNGVLLKGASLLNYSQRKVNDDDTLYANRFMCRSGGMFIFAPSGIGKSVIVVQAAIESAIGRTSFGIEPRRPLRSLMIQAEDDEGDTIEMAQIVDHLKLSEAQKKLVGENTWMEFVNDSTGHNFIRVVDRFLQKRPADVVWINPYSSYLGSDIKDDKANALFLRNWLNPVLTKHQCAAIIVAHTPKTNFRDTSEWKPSDWMYAGAGAAVLTNWARAVLVVDPTETHGVFRFIAAKRGQRIGWDGFEQYWAWSRDDGKLLWVPADRDQIALAKENAKSQPDDLLNLIPVLDPISQERLYQIASEKGIGEKKIRRFLKILEEEGKIHRHKIPREGAKAAVGYAKT